MKYDRSGLGWFFVPSSFFWFLVFRRLQYALYGVYPIAIRKACPDDLNLTHAGQLNDKLIRTM